MARCSLALGVLSHELLEASTASLAPATADRGGVERAQARLWLQTAVPNARELTNEWQPVTELADAELHRRAVDHVDAALRTAFGHGPGPEALLRWIKGLVNEVTPAAAGEGLPPSLGVADHVARGPHFENNSFVARVQDAANWFVVVANRLGEQVERNDVDAATLIEALCGGQGAVVTTEPDADGRRARWQTWQRGRRETMLTRGRNERPAFLEGVGETRSVHRSSAFTGMMNLSDLPQSELPPEVHVASLPPEAAMSAPPMPAVTQEVSLAAIAAATQAAFSTADAHGFVAPAKTQEISLAQIEAESRAFATPARTQEISLAQIEAEAGAFVAPARTQEISAVQIESEAKEFVPPETTQELSLSQIEAEARAASEPQTSMTTTSSSTTAADVSGSSEPEPAGPSSLLAHAANAADAEKVEMPGGGPASPPSEVQAPAEPPRE
jgi:hypothetical protein